MSTTASDIGEQRTPAAIGAVLRHLRTRVRRYVWIEGVAAATAFLGVAFWVSLGIDWFLEIPIVARAALVAIAAALLGYVILRLILLRAFVRLSDRSMAVVLERRFAEFGDSLLTTVELGGPRPREEFNREMLEHTIDEAAEHAAHVKPADAFNPGPLRRSLVGAAVLAGSVVVFALAAPDSFGIWTRRNLLLADELWPRKTRLLVHGFRGGVEKVAKGSDFALVAKADTTKLVPRSVQVRYAFQEGARGRANMSRDGEAGPGDEFQKYIYTFQGVLSSVDLDVRGGDDRVSGLKIEVVDSPRIAELVLHCEYPTYTNRSPRELPATAAMQLPVGTHVTLRARANKDLVKVEIAQSAAGGPLTLGPSPPRGEGSAATQAGRPAIHEIAIPERQPDRRAFEYSLNLASDETLLFTLHDTDGIRSSRPDRLAITAVPDAAPQVAVRPKGIGSAITPHAHIPVEGRITDDYGVVRGWFAHTIDKDQAGEQPFAGDLAGREEVDIREDFEARDLGLKPGGKLMLAVKAADAYALGAAPNEGSSEQFVLDVVTPDQLRAMLEARELNLRQRFEAIIEEVIDTRNSLLRVSVKEAGNPDAGAAGDSPAGGERPARQPQPDEPAADSSLTPQQRAERAAVLRIVRVQRAQQDSRKNASETFGVAVGFEEIVEELANNRVEGVEELTSRLKDGVAAPLRRIAEVAFPELDGRLEALLAALDDPAATEPALARTLLQVDQILVEMQQVLTLMLKLETYNELVDLLRSIIRDQDEVGKATKDRQKVKARQLLDE